MSKLHRKVEVTPNKSTPVEKVRKSKLKYESITRLVLHLFNVKPTIESAEMEKEVKRYFPKSKFHNTHFSWFKYQIKNGRYNVKDSTRAQLTK